MSGRQPSGAVMRLRDAVVRMKTAILGTQVLLLLLAAGAKPNIILVVTDDQEVALVDKMPRVKKLLGEGGTSFTHAFYNDPLCCPSRATILTGRYVQNHGV